MYEPIFIHVYEFNVKININDYATIDSTIRLAADDYKEAETKLFKFYEEFDHVQLVKYSLAADYNVNCFDL